MSRYERRNIAVNDLEMYKKTFEKRGVLRIKQYRTSFLKNEDLDNVPHTLYVWRDGDNFWKLSKRFFGFEKYWYIIARFNNAPTEAHLSVGDQIKIPTNLSIALQVVA